MAGPGPRTSRAAHTHLLCGSGVQGHTRSGAEDSGDDRILGEAGRRPEPWLLRGRLLKSVHHRGCCDRWVDHGSRDKKTRPGSFRIPGPCVQSLEAARLGACFSRNSWTFFAIKAVVMDGIGSLAWVPRHRCTAKTRRARDQPLEGSEGFVVAPHCHDDVLVSCWLGGSRNRLRKAPADLEGGGL